MSSNNFDRLAALVFAEESIAASLAGMAEPAELAELAARLARHLDDFDASSLDIRGNDPLGLSRWSAPRLGGRTVPPRHWLPMHAAAGTNGILVDWTWFGPDPLSAPFFEDSVRRALARPFPQLFRCRTTLDDLIAQAGTYPARAPDGFIFHMSRCGSTLAAQMFATLPRSIVISEAAPIDAVAQLAGSTADPGDTAVQALRAMIMTFGRLRAGNEQRYVVKLDSWHALALPLFRRAFPDVPWVFLYRDPVEVLVSQMRQRGTQMLPQLFPPRFWGVEDDASRPDEDYCARVLAAICNAAADHAEFGRGLVINYRYLPDAVLSAIAPHFGLAVSAAERAAMQAVARRDAKAPSEEFTPDGTTKRREASEAVLRAAERQLQDPYHRLERLAAAATGIEVWPGAADHRRV